MPLQLIFGQELHVHTFERRQKGGLADSRISNDHNSIFVLELHGCYLRRHPLHSLFENLEPGNLVIIVSLVLLVHVSAPVGKGWILEEVDAISILFHVYRTSAFNLLI